METSIRFIRVNGRAIKPALCFRGRNQAHAVINDETAVRVVSNIPLSQHDHSSIVLGPLGLGHREYPVDLFVKRFQEIGTRKGMTARAEFLLKRALEGGVADNEKLPPDELPEDPLGISRGLREIANSDPKEQPAGKPRPKPEKPASGSSERNSGASGGAARTAGAEIIIRIAAELKLETTKLRKILRSKGLSAPYEDEAKIRKALAG